MQASAPPLPDPASPAHARKRLFLIDASGFIFRAYYAMDKRFTRPDGTPVGAVYIFITMVMKLMEGERIDYVAAVFDKARLTFRNRLYPEYKAHRPPAPEDLVPQFPIVREAAAALGLSVIEMDDFEADDIIAAYALAAAKQGIEVVIVSSDKDLMQCIAEGVVMYDAMKQKTIGPAEVNEKFGVGPDRVRDVLALIGDSSDNVPGVPGIGPKTAAELIVEYGDLESLLARAQEIKQPKRRESLLANAENAKLSKELITLRDDIALPLPMDALALKQPDPAVLGAFLQAQGFKSLVARIQNKFGLPAQGLGGGDSGLGKPSAPSSPIPSAQSLIPTYTLVQDEGTLAKWIAEARAAGYVAFDTETTSLDAMRATLAGFSLCIKPGVACYVPLNHVQGAARPKQGNLFEDEAPPAARVPGQIDPGSAMRLMKPLLEDPAVLKIGQNIKYDMLVMLQRHGISIAPVGDTMLLSYTLAAGLHAHNMDELAQRYLGHKTISYDEVTGTGKSRITFDAVELDKARDYAAEDADVTLQLYETLRPRVMQEKLLTVYDTLERPLIPVLVAMERRGIRVDAAQLARLSQDFARRMADYEHDIYKVAGREFNVGSPKQLGEILFDEMRLEGGSKSSKTGAWTTDSETLEDLAAQGHTLPSLVLEWRQLSKLKSTYTDALAEEINPDTGRVHTSYAMAVASTGRLSSTDPNLQNIPIRTEEGKKIRHAFIADPGCKLISVDYSQIELRLLADIADIAPLKEAFRDGRDIHAITASQMFGVDPSQVNADLRRSAKTINFGIIYGISAHGLASRLGISRAEAGAYIERYFAQYPGIRAYMERTKDEARRKGFVTTLFGRRCHVPGILDKNAARRQFSERAAINAPLQGTAADILKRAMIRVEKRLAESGLRAAMLLTVHDELVIEAAEKDAEKTAALVKETMESAAAISVPLTVECGIGSNWGEIH